MNNFEDFLMDSFEDTQEIEREVTIGGKKKLMKFRPISAEMGDMIRKRNRKTKLIKGQRIMETDQDKYVSDLIIETTTCPDLKNSELQASWGVLGAEELLSAMKSKMRDGEFSDWSSIVGEVNGYDKSVNDLIEEAKN
ncbi:MULTISPECIES: hypothetical protein [unclassified Clostridium]|uniref:phage tail assembly chaperone n=1 Tax=unclassified Clostridium TaxID=2614128 RepID=UPI0013F02631|nr:MULTISPECIES: hypothetical protein [unclassified Clostridium]MBN1037889.1 hypothetical protein [Clostridium botulinum]MBN1044592.1 hypothetical protein [Clostridium botulinum]MBN1054548.1 hypothetical protein [Clostridium botulinum]NFG40014.1 hypothetical protein [Clostridium botulinum]